MAGELALALGSVLSAVLLVRWLLVPVVQGLFDPGDQALSLIRRVSILVLVTAALAAFLRFAHRRAATELRPALGSIGLGAASGALLILAALAVLFAADSYAMLAWHGLDRGLVDVAGVIFLAAFLEEVVYRAMLFQILERAWGTMPALYLQALVFGLAHVVNVGYRASPADLAVTLVSVSLLGALWAGVFILTRNLWAAAANHACWNFIIILSGLPLSGLEDWRAMAPLQSEYRGPAWLTGGVFGPEASVVTMLLVLAAVLLIFRRIHSSGALRPGRPHRG